MKIQIMQICYGCKYMFQYIAEGARAYEVCVYVGCGVVGGGATLKHTSVAIQYMITLLSVVNVSYTLGYKQVHQVPQSCQCQCLDVDCKVFWSRCCSRK